MISPGETGSVSATGPVFLSVCRRSKNHSKTSKQYFYNIIKALLNYCINIFIILFSPTKEVGHISPTSSFYAVLTVFPAALSSRASSALWASMARRIRCRSPSSAAIRAAAFRRCRRSSTASCCILRGYFLCQPDAVRCQQLFPHPSGNIHVAGQPPDHFRRL